MYTTQNILSSTVPPCFFGARVPGLITKKATMCYAVEDFSCQKAYSLSKGFMKGFLIFNSWSIS